MSYGPGWKLFKQRQHQLAEAKKARRALTEYPPERPAVSTAANATIIASAGEGPNLAGVNRWGTPERFPEGTAATADESGDLRVAPPPQQMAQAAEERGGELALVLSKLDELAAAVAELTARLDARRDPPLPPLRRAVPKLCSTCSRHPAMIDHEECVSCAALRAPRRVGVAA